MHHAHSDPLVVCSFSSCSLALISIRPTLSSQHRVESSLNINSTILTTILSHCIWHRACFACISYSCFCSSSGNAKDLNRGKQSRLCNNSGEQKVYCFMSSYAPFVPASGAARRALAAAHPAAGPQLPQLLLLKRLLPLQVQVLLPCRLSASMQCF